MSVIHKKNYITYIHNIESSKCVSFYQCTLRYLQNIKGIPKLVSIINSFYHSHHSLMLNIGFFLKRRFWFAISRWPEGFSQDFKGLEYAGHTKRRISLSILHILLSRLAFITSIE